LRVYAGLIAGRCEQRGERQFNLHQRFSLRGYGQRDLLAPLLDLPGVAEAAEAARSALGRAHRHRANLRNWPVTAAESTVRGARSSSALDGGGIQREGASGSVDPVLAGALRAGQAIEGGATNLVGTWPRAPLQALARLHALAAADLVDDDSDLGRPRQNPEVASRLDLMTRLVTGGSAAPAPVLAAVAHGEILALTPFGSADGVVARAVSRLVTIVSGLDPHGLGVPEVYWLRRSDEYRDAAAAFASGQPGGVGVWVLMCCRALEDGAREALSIAEAVADQPPRPQ
jgi:hypothetical protein